MPDRAQITALVEEYIRAVGAGDVEASVALFAPDARQEDPVGGEPNIGHEAIRAFFTAAADLEKKATRYGPITVMGSQTIFQIVITLELGEDSFQILFTDLVTVNEDGLVTELRGWNDGGVDLMDAPGARAALGL